MPYRVGMMICKISLAYIGWRVALGYDDIDLYNVVEHMITNASLELSWQRYTIVVVATRSIDRSI